MADITVNQIKQLIAMKLADDSDIVASEHREVENAILDFLVQELGKVAKSKVLMLESFSLDRNHSIDTGLPSSAVIDSVFVMLVCKTANNGFFPGDVVTVTTPYPTDSGRTAAQGIGVQYNNLSNSAIKVMVSDQLTIMTAYNGATGAAANNILITGANTANWSIKLIVGYK